MSDEYRDPSGPALTLERIAADVSPLNRAAYLYGRGAEEEHTRLLSVLRQCVEALEWFRDFQGMGGHRAVTVALAAAREVLK